MARFPSRSRFRSERGATLVEYCLLIAVFVIPVGLGVQFMQDGAEAKMGHVASGVARADLENPTTTVDGGDGGGGATTSTSTTTTAAPTTTVKPTTTTSTTTSTTTTSTTTTTLKASKSTGTMTQATSDVVDRNLWSSTTTITVKDNLGKPVIGAQIELKIRTLVVDKKGKKTWVESTETVTTGSGGKIGVTVQDLARKTPYVDQVEIVVTAITYSGLTWDGAGASTSADKP